MRRLRLRIPTVLRRVRPRRRPATCSTGIGTTSGAADTLGADGAASGGAVVSVALGGGTAVAVGPATGATIVGAFGTRRSNADGSYSYVQARGVAFPTPRLYLHDRGRRMATCQPPR